MWALFQYLILSLILIASAHYIYISLNDFFSKGGSPEVPFIIDKKKEEKTKAERKKKNEEMRCKRLADERARAQDAKMQSKLELDFGKNEKRKKKNNEKKKTKLTKEEKETRSILFDDEEV